MGLSKETRTGFYWNTFVEAETKTCIKEKVNMRNIIYNLQLQGLEVEKDLPASQTLRHVIYSQKDSEVASYGSDHVTVILSDADPHTGYVRPKRKLFDSLDMHHRYPKLETQKSESRLRNISRSVEYELIPFKSRKSKTLAIKSGLYKVGVNRPEDYLSSQPFIKLREKRLFRHPNGLMLEVSGDTIITKPETLQRIEVEIAGPSFPNSQYCEQLESATQHLRELLAGRGLTVFDGKSNSSLMKQLLTRKNEVSQDDIKQVLRRAEKEKQAQK